MVSQDTSSSVTSSLHYEVIQATTMALFVLSGIATTRQSHQLPTGGSSPIELIGLPELCFSPCVFRAPDDYLYGSNGIAAQLVYKGWVAEVYGLWENRFRNKLKDSLGPGSDTHLIRPQLDAFGDLRRIRNDLFHNNCMASADHTGKCVALNWFRVGEPMNLGTRHMFDFHNQAGSLMLTRDQNGRTLFGGWNNSDSYAYTQTVAHDVDSLLNWTPRPQLISIRTHDDNIEAPLFKGITAVFDNGLFAHIPYGPMDAQTQERLGKASIDIDGNLHFDDGTIVQSSAVYQAVVRSWCEPCSVGDGPSDPVTGPWMRIRK